MEYKIVAKKNHSNSKTQYTQNLIPSQKKTFTKEKFFSSSLRVVAPKTTFIGEATLG